METTRSVILDRDGQPCLEMQRPALVVVGGVGEGEVHLLPEGPAVLGRDPASDLRLDDPSVSRAHARFEPAGERWRVRDLGSSAGLFVAGERVDEAALTPGAELRVGSTTLRFELHTVRLLAPAPDEPSLGGLVGESPAMRSLLGLIRQVAPLDLPVLVHGETGAGKEGVARALHEASTRADGPYQVVDCTLLTGEHLRSELFGHVKGAFTGADADRVGAFMAADGGTLFLDEVGELPLDLQPALLRVLELGEVRPLGASASRRATVRVVAATHRDLAAKVRAGEFREDLYYRLSAIELEVLPLRARPEDLACLARHFLPASAALTPEALAALRGHTWPGNVRELKQVLEVAAALAQGGVVGVEHLRFRQVPSSGGAAPTVAASPGAIPSSRAEREKQSILDALRRCGENRQDAAKLLGIARSTLYERMKKYGID